jgi:ABC-type metal ion transport system substrate-binding protein
MTFFHNITFMMTFVHMMLINRNYILTYSVNPSVLLFVEEESTSPMQEMSSLRAQSTGAVEVLNLSTSFNKRKGSVHMTTAQE